MITFNTRSTQVQYSCLTRHSCHVVDQLYLAYIVQEQRGRVCGGSAN